MLQLRTLELRKTDNGSKIESQDEDLITQVLAKTENIKQFVEEKYCEPRDAIQEIETKA